MEPEVLDRVRRVLDASGLTQQQFADRIATTPDKFSKSLSGTRRFTTTELALVAELGRTTVDWLLRGEEPEVPRLAARDIQGGTTDGESVVGVAHRFVEAHRQLAMVTAGPPRARALPRVEWRRSGVAWREGAAMADAASSLVAGRHANVVRGELSGVVERIFGVDVAVVSLPGQLNGCAYQTETLRLAMVSPTNLFAQQRFTLAHELGHLLAGDSQDLIAEQVTGRSDAAAEVRANSFAANFLVPTSDLHSRIGAEVSDDDFIRLVIQYRVSPETLYWRLVNTDVVHRDDPRSRAWRSLTTEICYMKAGRRAALTREQRLSSTPRVPTRLSDGLRDAYWHKRASARPLAKLLQVEVQEVIGTYQQSSGEA